MPLADQNHPLATLLKRDPRYKLDAYLFVLEALQFAQDSLGMGEEPPVDELEPPTAADPAAKPKARSGRPRRRQVERHLTGQQLCEAARQYALQQYGYMARTVLELRLKLPADMAAHLPEGAAEIQRIIANYLGAKAGALAMAGRAWLGSALLLCMHASPTRAPTLATRSCRRDQRAAGGGAARRVGRGCRRG